jgi:hypothetical protein
VLLQLGGPSVQWLSWYIAGLTSQLRAFLQARMPDRGNFAWIDTASTMSAQAAFPASVPSFAYRSYAAIRALNSRSSFCFL